MPRDTITNVTTGLVGLARILNLLFGIAAVLLLVATWLAHGVIADHLTAKYGSRLDVDQLIWAVRLLASLGLVAVALIDRILRELGAVLGTLSAGDPFATANAGRITAIAWGLLGWQLLELALGALNWWIGRIGADNGDWMPSLGGWLAVLVAFVLARVFAAGSRMRDELAATI